jgi:hypothetical protein
VIWFTFFPGDSLAFLWLGDLKNLEGPVRDVLNPGKLTPSGEIIH